MANRKERQEIAKETLEIQDKGFYRTVSGNIIQLADKIKHCNENSCVYAEKDFGTLIVKKVKKKEIKTEFEVTNEHSISACLRLAAEISDDATKVACLNFASAKNVCGGMIGGSLAQEESLGLCSCLHSCLSQFHIGYYSVNQKDPKNGLYHNNLIYSPDCTIFRNDINYELLESPVRTSFITSPAVNKGVALKHGVKQKIISEEMLKRMHHVLAVAIETGHQVLVLGAWGCGVFRNDAHDIAMQFAHFLTEPNGIYSNVFQKVVFAVGKEERKVEVFRNVFT